MDDERFETLCRLAPSDPIAASTLREHFVRHTALAVFRVPGLDHRLEGSPLVGPVVVTALVDRIAALGLEPRPAADRVWCIADTSSLLSAALSVSRTPLPTGLLPSAALGEGEIVVGPGSALFGTEVTRVRNASRLAREGEILCTPATETVEVPDGVGRHRGPAAFAVTLGWTPLILKDYR